MEEPLQLQFSISKACALADRSIQDLPPPSLPGVKTTVVYNTYWSFCVKRQNIYFARLHGHPEPWSTDPILRKHKFTNVYRASDRVSQYLIRNVIYAGDPSPNEVFFRTILFKLFNRIETWELLTLAFGEVTFHQYRFQDYDNVLSALMARGLRVYSAAYIMPSGGRGSQYKRKHQMHLQLLEKMIADQLPTRLIECRSMKQAFDLLKSYPTIGDFLAYQYVTDLNYSQMLNWSEMEFVCPGPGARDGIRKCFSDPGRYSDADLIKLMTERQDEEFMRLGLLFPSLWGRKLQLIDCQNVFCEVDKYARVAHPEVAGLSGRTRIKQKFQPQNMSLRPWYPPKWNLNDRIHHDDSCV
jgi:hypothetical protein